MPWLAQREGLPDTHRHWADEGSALAGVFGALGYVEVPAPGAEVADEPLVADAEPLPLPEPVAVAEPGAATEADE